MGRIRSVKPQYWTDGKILRLSDSTALFFISLWNHSDDHGYFTLDTLELASETSRWRAQEVFKFLSSLVGVGLVRCSSSVGVGQIIGWEHQKISSKRASKWNETKIEWDNIIPNASGSAKKALGKDRIGEDRKGKDNSSGVQKPPAGPKSAKVWDAYKKAYLARYNVEPLRNQKVNSVLCRLVDRVGDQDATALVEFYLAHNDTQYLKSQHDVTLCLRDAEGLYTQMRRGRPITAGDVKAFAKQDYYQKQLERLGQQ